MTLVDFPMRVEEEIADVCGGEHIRPLNLPLGLIEVCLKVRCVHRFTKTPETALVKQKRILI